MKTLRPYQAQAVSDCWQALKQDDKPVLLMASVGAGKSLMIASILLTMQKAGKRALCLVNSGELVRNNCETFINEGGNASIYCASLGFKDYSAPVVFGTPQSVLNAITKENELSKIPFNIIVIDEAHNINFTSHRTGFMRILNHYKSIYRDMRVLGATGTNFRFKGTPIVGEQAIFKSQVGNITTDWLIDNDYLIKPHFEIDPSLILDFSKVAIKRNGQFDEKQLSLVIQNSTRLTALICKQIIHIMETQKRFGVFIFATTKKHAEEIYSHLPRGESAIILGETPQDERTEILDKARCGVIRYLVNIAIISVGVDVPAYDTIAYLRPTESLVLLVQTMGRVLRLSPKTNKTEALVLDFAGNIERHRDWDNPILLDAVKQTIDKDKPLVISCPCCNELNTEFARRCIGFVNKKDKLDEKERCSYYFEFKECVCGSKNDLVARHCWHCQRELIDPNDKLSMASVQQQIKEVTVIETTFGISGTNRGFQINCAYKCKDSQGYIATVFEHYSPVSEKSLRIFYGQFVKKHCENAGRWYSQLHKRDKVQDMLHQAKAPIKLIIAKEQSGIRIKKKIFNI